MGNCVSLSIPLDQSVNKASQWLDQKVTCIYNLKTNLTALETTMVDLMAKRDDLSRRLTREENSGLQRLAKFQVWLNRVETLEKKVNDLVSAKDLEVQRLCLCGFCSKMLHLSYRYGKSVSSTLREIEKLKSEDFEVIAEQALTRAMEEIQLQPIIVGQETMLEKSWEYLMKDEVGIMGMFGMGGVGKTTLLTQINNKFNKDKCGFDFVIWVVVSKELHVEKIQDEIAEKIGFSGVDWQQKRISQKRTIIYNFLKKKRFVLFLDDIWEKVNLDQIGVPDPRKQERCKVAFTTRSQDVCSRMGVEDPMEVQCLADDEAFELFEKKVGQITLGSDMGIPNLARIVAKKCCGLPLALNVIGETMSCKRTIQEWRRAIHVLNSYAAEFSGMEDKILPLLKYSYDSLSGDQVKSCLLYCSLFPEDDKILKEKLIEYWICEGIIDASEGIEMAEYEGYDIIGSLVRSSLLMVGVGYGGARVHMHDVVREMALWIASDLGKQKEAFIVRADVGLQDIPKVKNLKVVRRMSLMGNNIQHLDGSPNCLKLTTLLLQNAGLEIISSEFFKVMSKLVVLDLSANHLLHELPEGISKLVSLRYLNLFGTSVSHLPKGLFELRKLIYLDLEDTCELMSIDGISSLHDLKVLKLKGSWFKWDLNKVEELKALEHLEFLTTSTLPTSCLEQFLRSHRLMSCTQSLDLRSLESSEITLPATMDKLSRFIISDSRITEIKMGRKCSFLSLVEVNIFGLKDLRELTFVMFAPNLRILWVVDGEKIEDIIKEEKAWEVGNSGILPFLKLKKLNLGKLQQLKNIFWNPLPFPCLEEITIKECSNLRKLPLDSKSGKHGDNGLIIKYYNKEWIEGVEWEDEATETRFLSSCQLEV